MRDIEAQIEEKRRKLAVIAPQTDAHLKAIKEVEDEIKEGKKRALDFNSRIIVALAMPSSYSDSAEVEGLLKEVESKATECRRLEESVADRKIQQARSQGGGGMSTSSSISSLIGAGGGDAVSNKAAAMLAKRMAALGVEDAGSSSSDASRLEDERRARIEELDVLTGKAHALVRGLLGSGGGWNPAKEETLKYEGGVGLHSTDVVRLVKDMYAAIPVLVKPAAMVAPVVPIVSETPAPIKPLGKRPPPPPPPLKKAVPAPFVSSYDPAVSSYDSSARNMYGGYDASSPNLYGGKSAEASRFDAPTLSYGGREESGSMPTSPSRNAYGASYDAPKPESPATSSFEPSKYDAPRPASPSSNAYGGVNSFKPANSPKPFSPSANAYGGSFEPKSPYEPPKNYDATSSFVAEEFKSSPVMSPSSNPYGRVEKSVPASPSSPVARDEVKSNYAPASPSSSTAYGCYVDTDSSSPYGNSKDVESSVSPTPSSPNPYGRGLDVETSTNPYSANATSIESPVLANNPFSPFKNDLPGEVEALSVKLESPFHPNPPVEFSTSIQPSPTSPFMAVVPSPQQANPVASPSFHQQAIPVASPSSPQQPVFSAAPPPPPPPPIGAAIPIPPSAPVAPSQPQHSNSPTKMPLGGERSDLLSSIRSAGVGGLKKSTERKLGNKPVAKNNAPVKKHPAVSTQPVHTSASIAQPQVDSNAGFSFKEVQNNLAGMFGGGAPAKIVAVEAPRVEAASVHIPSSAPIPIVAVIEPVVSVQEPELLYVVEGLYDFTGSKADDLTFVLGDKIDVFKEHGDWVYGKKQAGSDDGGWFPKGFSKPYDKNAPVIAEVVEPPVVTSKAKASSALTFMPGFI
jgi:hypothetical protein